MVITKNLSEDIIKQLETHELVSIPASEADYLTVAHELPFKVEYHENEIITMGLASYWHEILTARFIALFYQTFDKLEDEFNVLASNSGISIPKFEGEYFMPDVMVVKGEPAFMPNSKAIITNPHIVVEVMSVATSKFDRESKLPEYKHIQSLQQIIYVNPRKVAVSTYIRTENPSIWLNQDFNSLDESIVVEGESISLSAIYKKIKFDR